MATVLPHTVPIQLTIITHSPLLRDGISTVLHPYLPGLFTAEGNEGATASVMAQLLLLDWNMGASVALNHIREWHRLNIPVLVIELPNDVKTLLDCIEAGASGYTLRGATAGDLAETIHAVLRGEAPCSPQLAAHLFSRLAHYHQHQVAATQSLLTERELEVLALLVKEYSNKAIAAALCIEVRTVKHHVHNILDKLQLHSRWEASHYAVQHGLVAVG